jgi:hypothetical protein
VEARGYNREAYLEIGGKGASNSALKVSQVEARATYIFKLKGPLGALEKVQFAANLRKLPEVDAIFCRVNGDTEQAITNWFSAQNTNFRPTFARISKAEKLFRATLCIRLWV